MMPTKEEMIADIQRQRMIEDIKAARNASSGLPQNPAPEQRTLMDAVREIPETASDYLAAMREGLPGSGLMTKGASLASAGLQKLTSDKPLEQLYNENMARNAEEVKMREDRSPIASALGNVTGAVVAPMPGAGVKGGIGVGTRVFGNAAISAVDMGTRGKGLFDKDEAIKGALLTGGLSGAAEFLPAVGGYAARKIQEAADWNTLKAAGAMTPDMRRLRKTKKSEPLAKYLRDSGAVNFGSSTSGIEVRLKEAAEKAGKKLGDTFDALGEAAKSPKMAAAGVSPGVNPTDAAFKIQTEVIDPLLKDGTHGSKSLAKKLSKEVDNLLQRGDRTMTLKESHALLKNIDDTIPWKQVDETPHTREMKKLRGIFKGVIEDKADEIATASGDQKLAKEWLEAKNEAHLSMLGRDISERRMDAIRAGQGPFNLGLYDVLAGGAGMSTANTEKGENALLKGLLYGVGSKVIRSRGPAAAGALLNKAAKIPSAPMVLQSAMNKGNVPLAITRAAIPSSPWNAIYPLEEQQ